MKEVIRDEGFRDFIKITYRVQTPKGVVKKLWHAEQHVIMHKLIELADEYERDGFTQTLRGFYYDLVSLDMIPNAMEVYSRIGDLMNKMRYAGLIDWDIMEDRARQSDKVGEWDNPMDFMDSAIDAYHLELWKNQKYYIEMFTEKDTMYPRLAPLTQKYHIMLSINRGYSSSSVYYRLSKRIQERLKEGKRVIILYVGDHDPSGLDMIRDLEERVTEFLTEGEVYVVPNFSVIPVALTIDQVKKLNLPENPAKLSDSRAEKYIAEFGNSSWEVDAMKPKVLQKVVDAIIKYFLDEKEFKRVKAKEELHKKKIKKAMEKTKW
jgi:hypothetical protein